MGTPSFIPWFWIDSWTLQLPFIEVEWTLQPFAALVLLATFIGMATALLFARRHDRSLDETLELGAYLAAVSFPVSYLLNGVLYEPDRLSHVLEHPSDILGAQLGWSMYGGIAGAAIGAWLWKWRRRGSILSIGDSFAFAAPFAWMIARVGCFVTHDHPGRVSAFPLAVADFRVGLPPYQPRHDLGLYDVMVLAAIAATFLVLVRKPRRHGFYLALLPLLYAPCRFLLDFLRAPASDGGDPRYAGFTPAQYGSLILIVLGSLMMRRILDLPTRDGVRSPGPALRG